MTPPVVAPLAARLERPQRKRFGAWYTPESLTTPLVAWAVRNASDRVLDPSCGDGAFLDAAASRLRSLAAGGRVAGELVGFDVDAAAISATGDRLRPASVTTRLETRDFLACDPEGRGYDAIVGNPPYIRFQLFSGSAPLAADRAAAQGVRLSRLASSWAAFVVHASAFAAPSGRTALVLPEELLHANYAAEVRTFLLRRFARVTIVSFERHLFPEAQERVVLLLAEGTADDDARLRLVRLGDVDDFAAAVAGDFPRASTYDAPSAPKRWDPDWGGDAERLLRRLAARSALAPLAAVGKAGIGYVSGANDYFVVPRSTVLRRGFPEDAFVATVSSARHVAGAHVTRSDLARLDAADEPTRLWTGARVDDPALAAYRAEGERSGVSDRYKCRVRAPWFVVPGVRAPDAFLTYMSDFAPRFSLNACGATCSNNLLAVDLDGVPLKLRRAYAAAFAGSATALSAECTGRRYGGGVLKLEPREADAVDGPAVDALRSAVGAEAAFRAVDAALRRGEPAAAATAADDFYLRGALGLSRSDVALLAEARERRRLLRVGARAANLRPQGRRTEAIQRPPSRAVASDGATKPAREKAASSAARSRRKLSSPERPEPTQNSCSVPAKPRRSA